MHHPRVVPREAGVKRPIIRVRADRHHRLEAGGPRAVEDRRQLAAPGKRIKVRVRVDQPHHARVKSPQSEKPALSRWLRCLPGRQIVR
jgi:hypothetical protein